MSKSELIYLCDECGWKGKSSEMKKEQDIAYDQYCCPKCNNVLFDILYGYTYCKTVEENRNEKITTLLK
jgi:predicted RNA-binding Zn-ribbon protein involved in translation (DUF1610 family)